VAISLPFTVFRWTCSGSAALVVEMKLTPAHTAGKPITVLSVTVAPDLELDVP